MAEDSILSKLTPSEQKTFLAAILSSRDGLANVKVDFEKLALARGFKSANSASVMYYTVRKKILTALQTADNKDGGVSQAQSRSQAHAAKPRSSDNKISTASRNRVTKKSAPQIKTKKVTHNTGADQACQVLGAAADVNGINNENGSCHVRPQDNRGPVSHDDQDS